MPTADHSEMVALTAQVATGIGHLHQCLNGQASWPDGIELPTVLRAAVMGIEPWLRQQGVVPPTVEYLVDPLGYFNEWWRLLRNVYPFIARQQQPIAESIIACTAQRH